MNYKKIKSELEQLQLPTKPSITELHTLWEFLYPLFLKPTPDYNTAERDEWSCYYKAQELFEQTLCDSRTEDRESLKTNWKEAQERGKSPEAFLDDYKELDTSVRVNTEELLETLYQSLDYPAVVHIPNEDSTNLDVIYQLLTPYFLWLEKEIHSGSIDFLKISWKVLFESQAIIQSVFLKWFKALEQEGLVEPQFSKNILLARELYLLQEQSDFLVQVSFKDLNHWIDLLDSENAVLRGIAAKCIGGVYTDWQTEASEFQGHKHIPIMEMLALLYQKQTKGKNVVGGFIDGIDSEMEGFYSLEKHTILKKEHFDVKQWVLNTAIDSPEDEPYIPGSQAFWFYVHEYFDFDAEACHQLIDGKRYWLAMMCAEESLHNGSYNIMKPVLDRLQQEAPKAMADEIKKRAQTCYPKQ